MVGIVPNEDDAPLGRLFVLGNASLGRDRSLIDALPLIIFIRSTSGTVLTLRSEMLLMKPSNDVKNVPCFRILFDKECTVA